MTPETCRACQASVEVLLVWGDVFVCRACLGQADPEARIPDDLAGVYIQPVPETAVPQAGMSHDPTYFAACPHRGGGPFGGTPCSWQSETSAVADLSGIRQAAAAHRTAHLLARLVDAPTWYAAVPARSRPPEPDEPRPDPEPLDWAQLLARL